MIGTERTCGGMLKKTTLCECGHAESQHHTTAARPDRRMCDYAGHSCMCNGYKRIDEWKDKLPLDSKLRRA